MEDEDLESATMSDNSNNDDLNPDEAEVVSRPYNEPPVDTSRPKPKSNKKKLLISLIVTIALLGGGGFYWTSLRPKPSVQPNNQAQTTEQKAASSSFSSTTKNYSSPAFRLSIDYPDDWTVDDSATDQFSIKSPSVSLMDASGASTTGVVKFQVRSKSLPMKEFDEGNATAALASEKIAYAKPSPVQRGETFVSFLRYASSTGGALAMDGIYITGNNGYTKDQAIPKADIVPIDPSISIVFIENCSGDDCPDGFKPLSIATSNWENEAFSGPLKTMLKSIIVN